MMDPVTLQKFLVIVIGAISGAGYSLYVMGWSLSADNLNDALGSGPNNIFFFPLWFFLACGPAVYIALALKTLPNFKPNHWMLLGGLQIAYSVLLLLYVMFGGMTLFILGTYVDGINGGNIEEIICSASEDFCVWIRLAFSGAFVSILFLIFIVPLNNEVCWKNIKKNNPAQGQGYQQMPGTSNFATYQQPAIPMQPIAFPIQAVPMQPGAIPMQQIAVPMQPGAIPMQQIALPMQPGAVQAAVPMQGTAVPVQPAPEASSSETKPVLNNAS